MKPDVRAFVLAGGRGRRLGPLTTVIPKPLVPVGDESILEILVKQLVRQGFPRITISLGYLGHLIQAVMGDGHQFGAEIDYTVEEDPLGTAGALGLLNGVHESHILMVNGDTFTDLDFAALVADHVATEADATIAVHGREVTIDFGVISHLGNGALDAYVEKPTTKYLVSMGVNVLHAKHLASFQPLSYVDLPDFLLMTKQSGGHVHCHETDCFWLDLGRVEDVKQAQIEYELQHERFTSTREHVPVAS